MGKNKNKKNNAAKAANTNDPDAIKVFTLSCITKLNLLLLFEGLGKRIFSEGQLLGGDWTLYACNRTQ